MSRNRQYLLLLLLPLYFLIVSFCIDSYANIFTGFIKILHEPDFLITDYLVIGGVGGAFFNASLVTISMIILLYILKMEVTAHTYSTLCLIFGFSLFGKNILNIWTILMGVMLYSIVHKTSITRYIYIGLYGTSLSPIITQIMQAAHLPLIPRLLLSLFIGNLIGFVLPPLATHTHYAHKGYSLYNVGFAAGIIATVVISVFKSFGLQTESRLIWDTGHNDLFTLMLSLLFLLMLVFATLRGKKEAWDNYFDLLKTTGIGGTDYIIAFSLETTFINMAINGAFATIFVLLVGGQLNGPTIGGIFTIIGFSTCGKHLFNIAPIMLGVYLASLTKIWAISDPSAMLALLFSTNLAPVAGEFGPLAGIIAGFLHSSVALNVGVVYSGMNLYNNGFAGGIVAIFMVPVIQSFQDRKARAKSHLGI